jgi:hypothetical protein
MARSASLAAAPAIVSMGLRMVFPHAQAARGATTQGVGDSGLSSRMKVMDGTDEWDATWQRQMKGCRELVW